jgi:hypothetical protein
MSSFKQRLGNALNQQLNIGTPSGYGNHTDILVRNPYGSGGVGATDRKSNTAANMNASRISGTSNNVLSERVSRISEKINEIHVSSL